MLRTGQAGQKEEQNGGPGGEGRSHYCPCHSHPSTCLPYSPPRSFYRGLIKMSHWATRCVTPVSTATFAAMQRHASRDASPRQPLTTTFDAVDTRRLGLERWCWGARDMCATIVIVSGYRMPIPPANHAASNRRKCATPPIVGRT